MSDMIERCALAMANSDCRRLDLPELASVEEFRFEHDFIVYKELARATIEAMEGDIDYVIDGRGVTHKNFKIVYKSDAALSQDTHSLPSEDR